MEPFHTDPQDGIDEHFLYYRQSFGFKSDDADGYNRLGVWLGRQGKMDEAVVSFRRAIRINPDHAAAYHNLGSTFSAQGKFREALISYEHASRLRPANHTTRHMIAALSGKRPKSPSSQFVVALFDQYAADFDRHLTGSLAYQTPAKLRQAMDVILGAEIRFRNAIDLGCGTGLSGMEFKGVAERLTGIDLSPNMVGKAREKKIYDILQIGDICGFLNRSDEEYDLFIAIDVFVYVGDLQTVFPAVRKRALRGAVFILSTESCEGHGYTLRKTGRYAHSRPYIQSLAGDHGFSVAGCKRTRLRKERRRWIMGDLFVLQDGCPAASCLARHRDY